SWMIIIGTIAGLLFLLKLIAEKIPSFAAALVNISGAGDPSAGSASGIANNIMARVREIGHKTIKGLGHTAHIAHRTLWAVADSTSIRNKWNELGKETIFKGPRSFVRDI